jgi:hypothetical protein
MEDLIQSVYRLLTPRPAPVRPITPPISRTGLTIKTGTRNSFLSRRNLIKEYPSTSSKKSSSDTKKRLDSYNFDNDNDESQSQTPQELAEYARDSQIQHLEEAKAIINSKLASLQLTDSDMEVQELQESTSTEVNDALRLSNIALIEVKKQLVIQTEQKAGLVTISSLETADLLSIIATRNRDSKQAAYLCLPQKFRDAWLLMLQSPTDSFEKRYENDNALQGYQQQFLLDIIELILADSTVDLNTILTSISASWKKSHKALDKTEFLVNMAKARELADLFGPLLKKKSSQSALKIGILKQIQPDSFRDYLDGIYGEFYRDAATSFSDMISHMIAELPAYILSERASKFIIRARPILDSNLVNTDTPSGKKVDDKETTKLPKCTNCKQIGHQTKFCKSICSIHGAACTAKHTGVCHYDAYQEKAKLKSDSKVRSSDTIRNSKKVSDNSSTFNRNRQPVASTIVLLPTLE